MISDNMIKDSKFKDYALYAYKNEHIVQVSYPRSGRTWVAAVIEHLIDNIVIAIDRKGVKPEVEYNRPNIYCTTHTFMCDPLPIFSSVRKYVFLVRDPRDSFLSHMYMHLESGVYQDEHWDNLEIYKYMTDEWKFHHETFLLLDPHIVYYEQVCLDLKKEALKVVDAIGEKVTKDLNAVLKHHSAAPGYKERCLKWQRDPHFTQKHNDFIWSELNYLMSPYGYTYDGHSKQLTGI